VIAANAETLSDRERDMKRAWTKGREAEREIILARLKDFGWSWEIRGRSVMAEAVREVMEEIRRMPNV